MSIAARVLVPVLAVAMGAAGLRAAQPPLEKFSATAVNLDAPTGTATGQMQIQISRWSTDAERTELTTALNEQGPKKMLAVLQGFKPVGTIRSPHDVGYNLRYARKDKVGTSDRIVLVTERPMSFGELRQGGKTTEYPFTVVELRIGPDGKGEGKMSIATKVLADKGTGTVALENYNASPVMLKNVQREQ
ncbi:MAG: hypothetical protein IT184_15290 [Acidobacteria bacterium]|nr:hypothetical protein [Acidobacteriota bacterium]